MDTIDIVAEYLVYLTTERGLSPATLAAYRRDLAKLTLWMKGTELDPFTLSHNDLREFVKTLSYDGLDPRSVHRVVSGISGFFKYLLYDGHIVIDPSENLIRPQMADKLPRFLNQEEVNHLLNNTEGKRDRALLELLYGSGLRASEVCRIPVSSVRWDEPKPYVCVKGKGDKFRYVPMSASSVAAIWEYMCEDIWDPTEPLFDITRQDVWRIVTETAKRACLADVYPHTLRHTFATHLTQRGADIRVVQQMLGHERIDTTAIYTHITSDELKAKYHQFHPRSQ